MGSDSARVGHSTSLSVGIRTSFYVAASLERNSYVRIGRDVDATSFLRPRRIRTSGKLSYGPKLGRPLNVRGRLAEWVVYLTYRKPASRLRLLELIIQTITSCVRSSSHHRSNGVFIILVTENRTNMTRNLINHIAIHSNNIQVMLKQNQPTCIFVLTGVVKKTSISKSGQRKYS